MTPVEVAAPSRLHFGMFAFGQPAARNFGGAGVMIDRPGLRLRIVPCERFSTVGPLGQRVTSAAQRFAQWHGLSDPPACTVEVCDAPPQHVGLGTGTQLALSVIAGLQALTGGPPLEPAQLAEASGRGQRSAVGTFGFVHGGMIVESGTLAAERIAPLEHRIELPAAWRFVLVVPGGDRGLSGDAERTAFDSLPPVSPETTAALRAELDEQLVPAAGLGDFSRFSESLYRYGRTSGMCFAPCQDGPFASPSVADVVARIRAAGVAGVGQSSWGPTVFAVVESQAAADQLAQTLRQSLGPSTETMITAGNRTGAAITALA